MSRYTEGLTWKTEPLETLLDVPHLVAWAKSKGVAMYSVRSYCGSGHARAAQQRQQQQRMPETPEATCIAGSSPAAHRKFWVPIWLFIAQTSDVNPLPCGVGSNHMVHAGRPCRRCRRMQSP